MTVHFVTEISDIFGWEEIRFVTSHADEAERASDLLRRQGLHVEVRDYEPDTRSITELEHELAAA